MSKYVISSPEATRRTAELLNRHPDRFLFGSDSMAPKTPAAYYATYEMYQPLWRTLTPEASEKVRKGNYERLFDAARKKVRAWEKSNVR